MIEKMTVWSFQATEPEVHIEAYCEFSDEEGMVTGPITVAARPGDGADGRALKIKRCGNWDLAHGEFLGMIAEYAGREAAAEFKSRPGIVGVSSSRLENAWPERGATGPGDDVTPDEARAYLAETVSRGLRRDLEPPLGDRRPGERMAKLFADRTAERVDFADLSLSQWRMVMHEDAAKRRYAAMRGLGLEILSKDPDPEVRRAASAADGYYFGDYVADRSKPAHLDRTLYANLTQKQRDWVRSGNAASRRRAVEAALGLDYLFDDPNPIVRQAVASRGYALDALAKDKNPKVREAAQKFLVGADMTLEEWAAANPANTAEAALAGRGGADKPGFLPRKDADAPKAAVEIGSAAEPILNGTTKEAAEKPGDTAPDSHAVEKAGKGNGRPVPVAKETEGAPAAPARDAEHEKNSRVAAVAKPEDFAANRQSSAEMAAKSAPAGKSEEPAGGKNNPGIDDVKQLKSAPDGDFGPFSPDPSSETYSFLLQKDLVEMVEAAAEKNGLDAGTAVKELFGLVELQIGEAVTSYLSGAGPGLAPEIDPTDRRYPTSPFSNHRLAVAQAGLYLDALWGDENPYVQGAVEEQLRAAGMSIEDWTDANPEKCYHPVNRMRGMELDAIAEPAKNPFGAFAAEPEDVVVTFDRDGGQTGKVALPEVVFGCKAVVEVSKERFSYKDGRVNIEGACKVTATDGDETIELTVAACHLVSAMRKAGVCADAGPQGWQAQMVAEKRAEQTPLRAQSRAKRAAQAISGIFKPSRARSADEVGRS